MFYKINEMKLNHGTNKPRDSHHPCLTNGCTNLFNSSYKSSTGFCNVCNQNRKSKSCEVCDDGYGIFQDDGIRVCGECLINYPIKEKN